MLKTLFKRVRLITPLVIITIFLFLMLFSTAASAAMLGDVNNDGLINIQDVALVQRHIMGFAPPLTDVQKIVADVNYDGFINVLDVTLIAQMSLGLINEFPILTAPALSSPGDNIFIAATSIIFQWNPSSGANKYELEVTRVSDGVVFKNPVLGNATSTTQYGFPNDDTQFRWRVRAGNDIGWSTWSDYRYLTNGTMSTLPAAPILLSPVDNATAAAALISFQWNPSSGANKYELEVTRVSDGVVFKNPVLGNVTSTTQYGFPNDGTQFRWRVRAGNDVGWGAWSGYRYLNNGTIVTIPATTVLLAPGDNANTISTSIMFEWKLTSGATKYELEVTRVSDGVVFKNPVLGNVSASIQTGFPGDGTQYKWRVRAGNNAGWGTWSDYRILNNGVMLTAPTLTLPVNGDTVTGTSVSFQWNAVSGANKYNLEVTRVNDGAVFMNPILGNVTATKQAIFPNNGTQYKWRVRAGSSEGWGDWSAYQTFTNGNLPAAPILSLPSNNANVSAPRITFEWNPSVGANKYELQINYSGGQVYRTVTLGNVCASRQIDFPNDGSLYTWSVRAGNDNGWGAWSSSWNLTNGALYAAPSLLLPGVNATVPTDSIEFKWTSVTGATKYHLEIIDVRYGTIFFDDATLENNSATPPDSPFLEDGTQYKWRVRAGDNTNWGSWSAYRDFINETVTAPAAPSLLSPAVGATAATESIEFRWTAITGANNYHLQVVKVTGGALIIDDSTITTNSETKDDFPNDCTEYMWRVKASTDGGTSWGTWSFYRNFTNGFWWNLW